MGATLGGMARIAKLIEPVMSSNAMAACTNFAHRTRTASRNFSCMSSLRVAFAAGNKANRMNDAPPNAMMTEPR